ncbi:cobalamin-binding protein [Aquibacillus sp. 3ASR75-11]|uniref:Cobalamin-binding protein n=1 Tax=Terrihalobacillus insolitus TaxID=2950438 RepID=A0A9X3WTQ6_9BACI|nr:cobalamin-binding protein [Terrihalobacillus insolitus]MDC3413565.1 cobalamin-binding protein [Terrihalobacillus insolitus]MDC3424678.1 cobalamin-binding protein [Terrihalobacillus insolitus]
MRVVSICPSNTELVEYLGEIHKLVGVDDYSDHPPAILDLSRVGPDLSIDMNKVEKLKPDLVLASLSVPGMEKNIEELERRRIPFIILNPNSLEEIAQDIQTVAEALGCNEKGEIKAKAFRQKLLDYKRQVDDSKKQSLYWEWWPKPVFTPGGRNWLTEISTLAGCYNIFETADQASVQTDWEEVQKRDPDHICMVWVGVKTEKMRPELVIRRPGWESMRSIQQGNIHVLEESLFCRPSPRLLQGIEKLTQIMSK